MNSKALSNVRILDFTHFLAGPFATYQLAMQGADVLKIEQRGGEEMRLFSSTTKEWADRKMSPHWLVVNAGKRSMTVNLASSEGQEIVKKLVREVDVVVENFRPGVMDRLGIGYEALHEINPELIYAAISGFGTTGPESATPSFDGKIQAMSGLMSLTGNPEDGPMRAGFAAADVVAGITGAFAISTALYQRTHTGRGQFVDIAMIDSLMNMFGGLIADYTIAGVLHEQFGNRSVSRLPTADRFRCGDGYIVLAVLTDKQFASLLTVLGRADALDDPRFADWFTRLEHDQALREIIETAMSGGDPKSWEKTLLEANIPCSTILNIEEVVTHPQTEHRGLIQEAETPYGPVKLVGPGFRFREGSGGVPGPAADVGEHTDDVLRNLGYDAATIADYHLREIV